MSEMDTNIVNSDVNAPRPEQASKDHSSAAPTESHTGFYQEDARRWWIKLIVQPLLLLGCGVIFLMGLGIAQRSGLLSSGGSGSHAHAPAGQNNQRYICPMMCTPPQLEPGRCPVCAMELVPASSGSGQSDSRSIQVDPVARRVANIQTVAVKSMPMNRSIRVIGELKYDEGSLRTISAYVDGRLDRLYADYTGVVVAKGDHLALLYSPALYSGQVELLLAKKTRDKTRSAATPGGLSAGGDLYASARERLNLLGMTDAQIEKIEQENKANARMHLCAPISGTVIEKLAVEGQYVKEGDPIYRLADLSSVWLMLALFPEDASSVRYGQKVETEVQSLPGEKFTGRVAFIDPNVDPKTRTVGVRVVFPNEEGKLRVGDYAKATIEAPIASHSRTSTYDPELAGKWISPRHPHIVRTSPGDCPICGVPLVPAADFGFADSESPGSTALVVPRDAVLMAGSHSVVYVETAPGRFEIRWVVLGPNCGDQITILSGVQEGEQIATRGNFLIDSQMQLVGNPSLIDPTKAERNLDSPMSTEMLAAIADLSAEDQAVVEHQRVCPVSQIPLGSMGKPVKMTLKDKTVFICCPACEKRLLADPDKYLAELSQRTSHRDDKERKIIAALSTLPPDDRAAAAQQRLCPVADLRLGLMGTPMKVVVNGTPVFICCDSCRESLLEEPEKYLAKVAMTKDSGVDDPQDSQPDLPPIGDFEIVEPQSMHRRVDVPRPRTDHTDIDHRKPEDSTPKSSRTPEGVKR